MTEAQTLAVKLSREREALRRMAQDEAAEAEAVNAATAALEALEARWRAAVVADDEAEAKRSAPTDPGERVELRALEARVSLVGDYLPAALTGQPVGGAAGEYNAALAVNPIGPNGGANVPLDVLLGQPLEERADAVTGTAANDGGVMQRPILSRLFAASVMRPLGVRIDRVPAGKTEHVLLTGGAAPEQVAEGDRVDSDAATFATYTLTPKRLSGAYLWSVEAAAHVAQVEQALRNDLGMAIEAAMSERVIVGDPPAPDVSGFLARIPAPSPAPTTVANFETFAGAAVEVVDGLHASSEREAAVVVGPATYRLMAKTYETSGIDTGGENAAEALMRRARTLAVTAHMPAPDSDIQSALVHGGTDAARGDSIAAVWNAVEVLRDPYTKAAEGQVRLTWTMLWDFYAAFRMGAYKRLSFKLA